jgi:hypothetical protein
MNQVSSSICADENRVICKVTLSSPLSLGLLSPPYPLFQWYLQSQEILLNLSMKCCNSALNAQGSRLIIVVVQLGIVKIYVAAAAEALMKKERQDETQFTTKVDGFLRFIPPLNATVLFLQVLF